MCLAVPGRIIEIDGDDPVTRSARVDFGGLTRAIGLAFTPDAAVDDYVLVHVGFAISVIDAAEAARLLDELRAIDAIEAAEAPA